MSLNCVNYSSFIKCNLLAINFFPVCDCAENIRCTYVVDSIHSSWINYEYAEGKQ